MVVLAGAEDAGKEHCHDQQIETELGDHAEDERLERDSACPQRAAGIAHIEQFHDHRAADRTDERAEQGYGYDERANQPASHHAEGGAA